MIFDFWDEVSKIILGEQTMEDFIAKFDIALQKECEYVLRKSIDKKEKKQNGRTFKKNRRI